MPLPDKAYSLASIPNSVPTPRPRQPLIYFDRCGVSINRSLDSTSYVRTISVRLSLKQNHQLNDLGWAGCLSCLSFFHRMKEKRCVRAISSLSKRQASKTAQPPAL